MNMTTTRLIGPSWRRAIWWRRACSYFLPPQRTFVVFRRTVIVNRTVRLEHRDRRGRFAVNPGISPGIVAAAARRPVQTFRVQPRVLASTQGVAGAVQVRPQDLSRSGQRFQRGQPRPTGPSPLQATVQPAQTVVQPLARVPQAQPLRNDEHGRLGPTSAARCPRCDRGAGSGPQAFGGATAERHTAATQRANAASRPHSAAAAFWSAAGHDVPTDHAPTDHVAAGHGTERYDASEHDPERDAAGVATPRPESACRCRRPATAAADDRAADSAAIAAAIATTPAAATAAAWAATACIGPAAAAAATPATAAAATATATKAGAAAATAAPGAATAAAAPGPSGTSATPAGAAAASEEASAEAGREAS